MSGFRRSGHIVLKVVSRCDNFPFTDGFVVCSKCFSVSICPKEDGSAQVHLNVYFFTHDIIDLSSCSYTV